MRPIGLQAVVVVALGLLPIHAQPAAHDAKPTLYNDVTGGVTAQDRKAKSLYGDRFRIIDVTQRDGFTPAGIKGFNQGFSDPRSTRQQQVRATVAFAFVVTPDGRVIEPYIVHSDDKRLAEAVLNAIRIRRYFPAKYRGRPVYALHGDEVEFGGGLERDHSGVRQDGLGIWGGSGG